MNRTNNYGRISLSTFIVDFFGALVPGLIYIFLSLLAFVFPLYLMIKRVSQQDQIDFSSFLNFIADIDKVTIVEFGLFILIISYVIGTFFYRLDPKMPDSKSCGRTLRKMEEKDRKKWVESVKEELDINKSFYSGKNFYIKPFYYLLFIIKTKRLYSRESKSFEYPYRFLRRYLQSRGLILLANRVTWSGEDNEEFKRRSKNFINILKTRIAFHYPEKCETIIKNEAHIRLTATMWYISKELIKLSFIGLSFSIVTFFNLPIEDKYQILIPISSSLFIIGFSLWIYNRALNFLHYQRVREIIFVMETAMITSRMENCAYIFNFDNEDEWKNAR